MLDDGITNAAERNITNAAERNNSNAAKRAFRNHSAFNMNNAG